ncbi:putative ribosomal protein S19e [Helianthus anomalus]
MAFYVYSLMSFRHSRGFVRFAELRFVVELSVFTVYMELPEWADIVKTATFLLLMILSEDGSVLPHFCKSSGGIIRHILQQLETMKIIDMDPNQSLSEKTRVIFLTAPPVNEAQLLQVLSVDGRKNELCQKYVDACEKLSQEMGIKAINLCNAFKQHDNWTTTCFM